MINVEMLSTGDEVLHGQIIDTNAAWLADLFFEQGLPLTRRNTVGDNLESLVAVLRERSEQCDVLIVNGGLGPTSDDLSALAAATAKGEGLVLHEAWLSQMARFFSERDLAQSLDHLSLPPGVSMGYRSSMPIIELKLTGPATQKEAMLALWPEVQRVAGESLIFEGTEGLPAQIAKHLQSRQLSVTLSEQFTGGLLALQLLRVNAPLLASEVVPFQQETLAQTARWSSERRVKHFAGLALFVGGLDEEYLNFALATPEGTHALRVKMSITRHSLAVRQEVCAMMALNMLRRWLNGKEVASEHGWINVVESLFVE